MERGPTGGLTLGPRKGPWIDIIPWPLSFEVTLDNAEDMAALGLEQGGLVWSPCDERSSTTLSMVAPGQWVGVQGAPQDRYRKGVAVRFLHRPNQNPLDALRQIERHEGGLPPGVTAALLTALVNPQQPGPLTYAICTDHSPTTADVTPQKVLRGMVEPYIRAALGDHPYPSPKSAIDRYLLLSEVGHSLWNEERAREYAARVAWDTFDPARLGQPRLALLLLTEIYPFLRNLTTVSVGGRTLRFNPAIRDAFQWSLFLEMAYYRIGGATLDYLCEGVFPDSSNVLEGRVGLPVVDEKLAIQLSRALLRQAQQEAHFVPLGGFRLTLPNEYPLRQWGIPVLRVWADPKGLWVRPETGKEWVMFRWVPGEYDEALTRLIVPDALRPLMHVTLAALWRDLTIAGEMVIRPRHRAIEAWPRQQRPSNLTEADDSLRVVELPRRLYLHGELHQWGDDVERAHIQRRAHGVRAHLRECEGGASDYALENASQYGMVVPDGYTFVKPHVRCGDGSQEATDIIVRARGLASVMGFLARPA